MRKNPSSSSSAGLGPAVGNVDVRLRLRPLVQRLLCRRARAREDGDAEAEARLGEVERLDDDLAELLRAPGEVGSRGLLRLGAVLAHPQHPQPER